MRLTLVLPLLLPSLARAEHRVALVLGEGAVTKSVVESLAKYGFRSETSPLLDREKLEDRLEAFARHTPTLGTALVYYTGPVGVSQDRGREDLYLCQAGTDLSDARNVRSRGVPVSEVFEWLDENGGAVTNIVLLGGEAPDASGQREPPSGLLGRFSPERLAEACATPGDLVDRLRGEAAFANDAWLRWANDEPPRVTGTGTEAVGPPDRVPVGKRAGDEWVNARGIVFCWCPPGEDLLGSPADEPGRDSDEDQHAVTFESGYWVGKYELTVRESIDKPRGNNVLATGKNDPVTRLKRPDTALAMLRKYTEAERKAGRLPSDWEYAFPTDDEWEYAARAGADGRFCFGDDIDRLPEYANIGDRNWYETLDPYSTSAHRTLDDGVARVARVGRYQPNAWGLHDVHGNVAEQTHTPNAEGKWDRNCRGGSWVSLPDSCRCAYRYPPGRAPLTDFMGWRLVLRKVSR